MKSNVLCCFDMIEWCSWNVSFDITLLVLNARFGLYHFVGRGTAGCNWNIRYCRERTDFSVISNWKNMTEDGCLSHSCIWPWMKNPNIVCKVPFVENDMRQRKFVVSHFLTAQTKAWSEERGGEKGWDRVRKLQELTWCCTTELYYLTW